MKQIMIFITMLVFCIASIVNAQTKMTINATDGMLNEIIDAMAIAIADEPAIDIADVLKTIVQIRTTHDLSFNVDEALSSAFQHFMKAMEALAKGNDPFHEIEQGYEKLENALTLAPSELIDDIEEAMYVFPADLEITDHDLPISGDYRVGQPMRVEIQPDQRYLWIGNNFHLLKMFVPREGSI